MVQVAQTVVASQADEDAALDAINMLVELAECPAPLLQKSLPDILSWALQVGAAQQLSLDVRQAALQVAVVSHMAWIPHSNRDRGRWWAGICCNANLISPDCTHQ